MIFNDYYLEKISVGENIIPTIDRDFLTEYYQNAKQIDSLYWLRYMTLPLMVDSVQTTENIIKATIIANSYKYKKLYDTLQLEYNPIYNVDGETTYIHGEVVSVDSGNTVTTEKGEHIITNANGEKIVTNSYGEKIVTNNIGEKTMLTENGERLTTNTFGEKTGTNTFGERSTESTTGERNSNSNNSIVPFDSTANFNTTSVNSHDDSFIDYITAHGYTDTSTNSASTDTVTNGASTDTVTNRASTDTITNGASTDTATNSASTDTVTSGASTDTVTNGASTDTVTSGASTDTVTNGERTNTTRTYTDREIRKGNIGVTTTQKMIEEERQVALFNFYDILFKDIIKNICVPIWTNLEKGGLK